VEIFDNWWNLLYDENFKMHGLLNAIQDFSAYLLEIYMAKNPYYTMGLHNSKIFGTIFLLSP